MKLQSISSKRRNTQIYTLGCNNAMIASFLLHVAYIIFSFIYYKAKKVTKEHTDIWKNGILIVNDNTVRSVIEFTDQTTCIKLQMQCHKSYLHELAKERSRVLGVIRSVVSKLCPNFKTAEFLLLPQSYPINNSIAIPVQKIAQSVNEYNAGVIISSGKGRSKNISCPLVHDILGIDSIQALEKSERQLIFDGRSSDSIISPDIFDCMKGKFPMMNIIVEMTYNELYQEIIKYSIFSCESFQVSLANLIGIANMMETFPFFEDCNLFFK